LFKINSAANCEVLVKILGIKEPPAIYPSISFHVRNDPAQNEVVGIKYWSMLNMAVFNACIV